MRDYKLIITDGCIDHHDHSTVFNIEAMDGLNACAEALTYVRDKVSGGDLNAYLDNPKDYNWDVILECFKHDRRSKRQALLVTVDYIFDMPEIYDGLEAIAQAHVDTANAKSERAEYERLKAKYGGEDG